MMTVALIIFLIMYVLMTALPSKKIPIVYSCVVLFLVLRILPLSAVPSAINWNVLLMIAGTGIVVEFFIDSRMPERIADLLLDKASNGMWITIFMALFAGAVSAFIDNVATVLMVAPVGLSICRKLKVNPVPMVLAIAVSSNLQGAATLVGDTTSILLGGYAGMTFNDFFWMNGRPGIFFAVELGAIATVPIMMFLFRDMKQPVQAEGKTEVTHYFPSFMLLGVIVLLILASFLPNKPELTNGLICCALAVITMIEDRIHRGSFDKCVEAVKAVDYNTLLLLIGLFLMIEGLTRAGVIDRLAEGLVKIGGDNRFLLFTLIVWGSVLISAFVDNIPYVATMLPVIEGLTRLTGGSPYLLYFGLLTGATLGGNITPIGASANIAATGILQKEGYTVEFKDFARIGLPFTLAAVLAGYLFIWFVWA